jgi:hypothetical protein
MKWGAFLARLAAISSDSAASTHWGARSRAASRSQRSISMKGEPMSKRSNDLADRLEQGARALAELTSGLTEAEWHTQLPRDGRTIGVVVHHVATMYPLEIMLAQTLAAGKPVVGVTWADVDQMNAQHAAEYSTVTKEAALDLLRRLSASAAAAIRALSDEQLDRAAPVSLNADAPLTCQFMLEDHAVRHSYHHLARIRAALRRDEIKPAA